jgi:NAD(P)-dependent dehydrogenase (short-subunit alcohol dehydrogenase family)
VTPDFPAGTREERIVKLNGKVAIVTGGGAGIGLAIVQRFVAEGAKVVAADVTESGVASAATVPGVVSLRADVTQQADIDALVAAARKLGRIDILVNNAGIVDRFLPAGEMTDEVWDRVMAVNLTGPMKLCRAVIPGMVEQGSGVIVNVASIAGVVGGLGGAAYTASKHGLIGLTENIASSYLGTGIRCVGLAPGAIDTGISLGGEPSERGMAMIQRRLAANPPHGVAEQMANAVLFLASDEASFVNGTTLIADGGWVAG